ncbi:MAG: phosphatidylserine decarboxylase [bacterium]
MENNKKNVYFFDQRGKLVEEKIEWKLFLNFIYKNKIGLFFRKILNKSFASKIFGFFQNRFFSKYRIKSFIKKYNIDESEFEKNINEIKSFNDFFTRKLKPGSRQIDKNNFSSVISPADSKIFVIPQIYSNLKFNVKNCQFDLKKFLGDKKLAQNYENGSMLIFRLAPYDYHRYHFPIDCFVEKAKLINGLYDSVNPLVFSDDVKPLTENERKLIILTPLRQGFPLRQSFAGHVGGQESEKFADVLMVVIGAMMVGKIKLTYKPDEKYKKGDECGYFEFGASSIALLFKKNEIKINDVFIKNSAKGFETEIKMGQVVGSFFENIKKVRDPESSSG